MHPISSPRDQRPFDSFPCRLAYPCLMLALAANAAGASSQPDPPTRVGGELVAQQSTQWPVALQATEGIVEIYQPQPEVMKGDTLTARAAVSLTRPGAGAPVFGVAWFTARIATDRDTRTVTLHGVTAHDVRLPGSTAAEEKDFVRAIGGVLSAAEVTFPLDQLTASLDTAHREELEAGNIQTVPPRILISTTPATLISVNGAPRLLPVEGQPDVSRVANTPFIILQGDADRRYYLKAGSRWVSAADLLGPWADNASVPPAIAAAGDALAIPETPASPGEPAPPAGVSAPDANPPGAPGSAPAASPSVEISPGSVDAKIIVATEPTELIVTAGNPQFTPVPGGAGGQLLYASNTDSDIFLDQAAQRYYVLLSGRWYAAGTLQGSWQYVASDQLPPAFAQIPVDSAKGDVLPFVAGTSEAHEAVLDASIPQTATIRRDAGADLTVAYDGDPSFQDVSESPGVAYALNTPEDVLRVDGRYYCCHQAVWYESAAPTGPWTVCVSVPQTIYTLPPSCPDYHVRYVNVYDYTDDDVTCGYLPGYTGTYVYGPTIVYGTGYTYPGWCETAYFPPPCTWGFSAYYDPFACAWGFDVGLFWGRFGWFGHPFHERWWRDHPGEHWGWHRWWGPGGFVHSHDIRGHLVDARHGGAFRVGRLGGGPGPRLIGRDHGPIGWNNIYARDGNAGRNFPPGRIGTFTPARAVNGQRDNLFAGSDGRVFRQSGAGWEEHRGAAGGWAGMTRVPDSHPAYRPMPSPRPLGGSFMRPEAGLEQHAAARSMGAARSSTIHSFGGMPHGATAGGGFQGGGFRGGGGHGGGGGGHR